MGFSEYVPGQTIAYLRVELWTGEADFCEQCRGYFLPAYVCQISWQESKAGYDLFIDVSPQDDLDGFFGVLGHFLDKFIDVKLVQTRMVSSGPGINRLGRFSLVAQGEPTADAIVLRSSQSFGTGGHPSTQLMAKAMGRMNPFPAKMLDVGCGSGILSIYAARLGATDVMGVDVCPESIVEAQENVQLNSLSPYIEISAQPLAQIEDSFDLVVANLTCSVFLVLIEQIIMRAKPGAPVLVSGLQGRQVVTAEKAMAEFGWRCVDAWQQETWQARKFAKA